MKKKFFAIYALVGALVASPIFTSCVDDEESPSVTAIRDAKTAELKSIAALKKAEAQAEATLAAAQVALKTAQAEAQIAAAKLAEAEAALQETQNAEAAVNLEVQKKAAEKELARIQAEIEEQELLTEKALLEAQTNLLEAKKQLDQATSNYDATEKAKLQALATKYANAVTDLLNAKKSLNNLLSTLAMYETGFADAKVALEETKAEYNNKIAYAQARIDVLKQFTYYTEDIQVLAAGYVKADNAWALASENYNLACYAYNEANNGIDNEKLNELAGLIKEDEFYRLVVEGELYDAENEEWNWDWTVYNYVRNYAILNPEIKPVGIPYEYEDVVTNLGEVYTFEYEKGDYRQFELEVSYAVDYYKNTIKNYEESVEDYTTQYTEAVAATAAAKKAWDEAEAADKDAKKAEYDAALNHELNLKNAIEWYQSEIEYYNGRLANLTKALDLIKNEETLSAALKAKVDAYNAAAKAEYDVVAEAWMAKIDAQFALEAAEELCYAFEILLNDNNGPTQIASAIEYWEGEIESYQKTIAEAEKLLASYYVNGAQMSYEDLIAWQKTLIEAQEAYVAAYEVAVAEAKAALDAAMPAEEE